MKEGNRAGRIGEFEMRKMKILVLLLVLIVAPMTVFAAGVQEICHVDAAAQTFETVVDDVANHAGHAFDDLTAGCVETPVCLGGEGGQTLQAPLHIIDVVLQAFPVTRGGCPEPAPVLACGLDVIYDVQLPPGTGGEVLITTDLNPPDQIRFVPQHRGNEQARFEVPSDGYLHGTVQIELQLCSGSLMLVHVPEGSTGMPDAQWRHLAIGQDLTAALGWNDRYNNPILSSLGGDAVYSGQ